MIQSSYNKPIEPKAPKAQAPLKSETNLKSKVRDLETSLEKDDFESEMKAANASEGSTKTSKTEAKSESKAEVKSTEASTDQEIKNTKSNSESVSPKAFDQALTEDVAALIAPKVVSVEQAALPVDPTVVSPEMMPELSEEAILKLATAGAVVEGSEVEGEATLKSEIAQAMLKTPQVPVQGSRAPAIEMTKAEVDPQLLNMEDFVAQKNLVNKKALPNQAYGMQRPAVEKLALENGLKSTQVVKDIGTLENPASSATPMNSQQFILNMMNEQGSNATANAKGVETAAPVFAMSQVQGSDSEKIMTQISDYIVQAKAAKEPTVNMRMNHAELGMIDITVSKAMGGMNAETVAINIGAHSLDGKNFFQQNSKDLFAHLASAGINVTDMKVETPSNAAKNDFDFAGNQKGQNPNERHFGSEQNERRNDQQRRQDLWKLLNQEAA